MRLIDADALTVQLTIPDGHIKGLGLETVISVQDVLKIIKTAPTVEPKRGRWVKMTGMMPPEYHGHYECSECGWHMKGVRTSWTREEEMTYCPQCGAIMLEGGETDEDRGN